jgi:23S rRNA (cytidine1920-2'-O)/16S rRNA (cytidine1409-2'-O)-methyltransferase
MAEHQPTPARPETDKPYVGRGGLKLAHALSTFVLDVRGLVCADFGANVGGFTDCLLRAGAAHVLSVDTSYGTLAWTLRNDPRVTVLERTNALHAYAPAGALPIDFIAMDMGWTPQRLCVPAALRWLRAGPGTSRIVTLVKPHYEASDAGQKHLLNKGVLNPDEAQRVMNRVVEALPALGVRVLGVTPSPILGGATRGNKTGNTEYLALLERT